MREYKKILLCLDLTDDSRKIAERAKDIADRHGAQHFERCRATVDQVAGQPEAVAHGIETQAIKQGDELRVAALQVADRVVGHRGG